MLPDDPDRRPETVIPDDGLDTPAEETSDPLTDPDGLPPEGIPLPESPFAPDGLAADTTAPALGLLDLYRIVEERYARTPYAERAQDLRAALSALQVLSGEPRGGVPDGDREPFEEPLEEFPEASPETLPDETVGEPFAGEPAPEPDDAGQPLQEADPDAALPPQELAVAPPDQFGLEGEAPLAAEFGGYAWRVAAVPYPLAARRLLRSYAASGLRAAVVLEQGDGDSAQYVLLVGQFASAAEAETVRDDLPATAIGPDLRITALSGLTLLDENALLELGRQE